MAVLRMRRPTRVTRGSFLSESTGPLYFSASLIMDRNL